MTITSIAKIYASPRSDKPTHTDDVTISEASCCFSERITHVGNISLQQALSKRSVYAIKYSDGKEAYYAVMPKSSEYLQGGEKVVKFMQQINSDGTLSDKKFALMRFWDSDEYQPSELARTEADCNKILEREAVAFRRVKASGEEFFYVIVPWIEGITLKEFTEPSLQAGKRIFPKIKTAGGDKKRAGLSKEDIADFILDIGRQYLCLSKKGYIVADMTPENVMLSWDEEKSRAKADLIDFAASVCLEDASMGVTELIGKPGYMDEETARQGYRTQESDYFDLLHIFSSFFLDIYSKKEVSRVRVEGQEIDVICSRFSRLRGFKDPDALRDTIQKAITKAHGSYKAGFEAVMALCREIHGESHAQQRSSEVGDIASPDSPEIGGGAAAASSGGEAIPAAAFNQEGYEQYDRTHPKTRITYVVKIPCLASILQDTASLRNASSSLLFKPPVGAPVGEAKAPLIDDSRP